MKPEIYVSTDIETDGPIPGENSMLSFASVAFNLDGSLVGSFFTRNLKLLPSSFPDPKTAIFWAQNQAAYDATRKSPCDPEEAMVSYTNWLNALPGKPVFVAYPAGFDFTFVYWYLQKFTGGCPFGFSALDMKTLAMTLLGKPYRQSTKKVFPKEWFPANLPHTHVALDDAKEQAEICRAMLDEALIMRSQAAEYDRFLTRTAKSVTDLFLYGRTTDVVSKTFVPETNPEKITPPFSCCEGSPSFLSYEGTPGERE